MAAISVCYDYSHTYSDTEIIGSATPLSRNIYVDAKAGDRIWVTVTPHAGGQFGTTVSGKIDFNSSTVASGAAQSSDTSLSTTRYQFTADTSSSGFVVAIETAASSLEVDFVIGCEAGALSGAVETIQNSIVRESTMRSTELITGIVNSSIDAAYAGSADGANSFMGYAGTVMTVAPFEQEDGSNGGSFWAGLRYGVTFGNADQWAGTQVAGAGGVNFTLDDAWMVGVFAGVEQSGYSLTSLNQTMGGSGYSLGVTGAYRMGDWRLELLGYGSGLGYKLDNAGTTASFGAVRYVIDGKFVGTLPVSATMDFAPELGVAVVNENQDAYTDSANTAYAAQQILAAKGTAGGKFIFYPVNGGWVFSTGAYADYWTTENQSNSGLTGRVELGTTVDVTDSARIGVKGSVNSIGGKQLGASVDAGLKAAF